MTYSMYIGEFNQMSHWKCLIFFPYLFFILLYTAITSKMKNKCTTEHISEKWIISEFIFEVFLKATEQVLGWGTMFYGILHTQFQKSLRKKSNGQKCKDSRY